MVHPPKQESPSFDVVSELSKKLDGWRDGSENPISVAKALKAVSGQIGKHAALEIILAFMEGLKHSGDRAGSLKIQSELRDVLQQL